jgi:hypothetical protein
MGDVVITDTYWRVDSGLAGDPIENEDVQLYIVARLSDGDVEGVADPFIGADVERWS